jgi:hypothetical protein
MVRAAEGYKNVRTLNYRTDGLILCVRKKLKEAGTFGREGAAAARELALGKDNSLF